MELDLLTRDTESSSPSLDSKIRGSLACAMKKLSPTWDTRDYVAVNPFFALRDQSFLTTMEYIQNISGRGLLPKKEFFREKYNGGSIQESHLIAALSMCRREELNKELEGISISQLLAHLDEPEPENKKTPVIRCLSDLMDMQTGSEFSDKITEEISKWCSVYIDEGQSTWGPRKGYSGLYQMWRELAVFDKAYEKLNPAFTRLLKDLPISSEATLVELTKRLLNRAPLNETELGDYYYRLLFTVQGWASYLKKFEFEAARDKREVNSHGPAPIDLLAMRLTYDVALLELVPSIDRLIPHKMTKEGSRDQVLRYVWLNALEESYRSSLIRLLEQSPKTMALKTAEAQMVFCIDVRSEVIRRHLEQQFPNIQTLGFAGFFGLPIRIKGLGHKVADQNCPVLISPSLEVSESSRSNQTKLLKKKAARIDQYYLLRGLQHSSNSLFSFVETLGFNYLPKFVAATTGSAKSTSTGQENLVIDSSTLSLEQKLAIAYGALKNMGLTSEFAKYVFFFGHASTSTNNPYAGALDCGACAGHSGHGNSKLLASILNDKTVRLGLNEKGIVIPDETIFLSGWHNTTKDEINVDEPLQGISLETSYEITKLQGSISKALMATRQERAINLRVETPFDPVGLTKEYEQRATDWSEVRPEWGLAKNAAFFVGRRSTTRGLNLEGRSFLHDYDFATDSDLSRLELIMTAPMIVTNWINMQYYASTVDPVKFGAGNKLLNNVVGGIGCVQGNGGDLLGGLTEQSVWLKGKYYHEPIRLQVFIEAETSAIERIMEKHLLVKELVANGWLRIISIDPLQRKPQIYLKGSWYPSGKDVLN